MTIFDLEDYRKEQIDAKEIDGLDSFELEGTIDILEAMLTSFKWSLVPGGLLNTIFINVGI